MWNIIYLFYTIPNSRWLEINTRTNDISVMAEIKEEEFLFSWDD